ncbi:EndoU domain-containing protein [Enterococcus sp. AZ126]|uniref:EndoU domain-containing protein n=1 Tax=Enterococcus sp. AZ126 TaxID=2774635 RepID=UPI003F297D0E
MSVDMYVSASQNQASSVSTMCKSQAEGYQELQKAINDFTLNAPFLTGKVYDSAKDYFQSVLYPLAQGGILLSEAVEKAVKKFPEEYISQVDSGDLKESELQEKIRQADRLLNQAEDIRRELNSSKTPDITKSFQLNANSMLIGMYSASKQKLEEQLRKLLAFNASSPSIFSEISSLQSAVNQGLAQTSIAWNAATGTFTIPEDLSWRDTIGDKWKLYQDNIHGINEKKNKELEKYNVYAVIYTDADGNPKISWQIEDKKTGYGITNPELYRYLSKAGNYLDSDLIQFMTYDAYDKKIKSGWRNGINYVTGEKLNPVLGGIVAGSQYIEDGVNWINESELGQAIQILGFTYASYKITTSSGTKQINSGNTKQVNSVITPEMEEKILWGQRKNPNKNEIIGGHSPEINNNHPNYATETIKVNADGTRDFKYTTQFSDGNLAKIKNSTVFPDSWTDTKILNGVREISNSSPISVRGRDGATFHRGIVDGVEIDVIKLGDNIISGYPTGQVNAPIPGGFTK